jgi:pimeloyl-ACP methyl ester carboxylesterase
MLKSFISLLTVGLSLNAFALMQGHEFHAESLRLKAKHKMNTALLTQEIGFYDQLLRHEDPSKGTFKQRYFVDSKFAEKKNSPVFYIICGEWNCAGTGSYSFVEKLAKTYRGHLVALEHRFYGESLPTKVLTSDALEDLGLEAALSDLARFQEFMMKEKGLDGKWIAVGGSYAGTLAAFYREKRPDLVTGALASSAPVFAKNAFHEYDLHVAQVINRTECGDNVRRAVSLIEEKLKTPEGTSEVKALFNSKELENNKDFLYVVADMLAAAVQYGRDELFCKKLGSSEDLVKGYAEGGLAVLSSMGNTPFEISLAVAERLEVTADDNMRQWLWQSCTQFGWFQVANSGTNTSRSSLIDLEYHDEICQRLYQRPIGMDGALNGDYYFPLFKEGMGRIIFSNGSNDPWLTLSVTHATPEKNPALDLFMIEGSAHCNDLRFNSMSLPSVVLAQMEMEAIIGNWLK